MVRAVNLVSQGGDIEPTPRLLLHWSVPDLCRDGSAAGSVGKPQPNAGFYLAVVAQMVERVLGKDEVTGSIPVNGSRILLFSGVMKHGERKI